MLNRSSLRAAIFCIAALAAVPTCAPAQTAAASPLTLEQVLQAARDNPDVSIARRGAEAARADITSADHGPAPVLTAKAASIDLQNGLGSGSLWRDKRIDKSIGVDWTWERGNKRELRTQQARRNADAAQADLREVLVQQQLAAASAFYDLLAAQERMVQVEAIGKSAAELSSTAARRVRAGDLSAQVAARTEIESQRAAADLHTAQSEKRRASYALSQLIGVAPPTGELTAQSGWPTLTAPDAGTAYAPAAPDDRADVQAAQQRVQAAQAALDGANALRSNDVTLGASLDHFPGTSTRQLELRAQIPLAGLAGTYAYDGEIARARALLDQAQDQLDKTRRVADAENRRMQHDLESAARRAQRSATSIVPPAREVAAMAELAYGKGAMSLTELIDTRRTLRNVLIDDIAARADHARNLAAWRLRAAAAQ